MAVTEDEIAELARSLRAEFKQQIDTMLDELAVKAVEAHNNCEGLTPDEVRQLVAESFPAPAPGLTRDDVEQMLKEHPEYDDDEVRKMILRLRVYANGLADRIGAPRLEEEG